MTSTGWVRQWKRDDQFPSIWLSILDIFHSSASAPVVRYRWHSLISLPSDQLLLMISPVKQNFFWRWLSRSIWITETTWCFFIWPCVVQVTSATRFQCVSGDSNWKNCSVTRQNASYLDRWPILRSEHRVQIRPEYWKNSNRFSISPERFGLHENNEFWSDKTWNYKFLD